jgi:CRP-like cAMP-binding protein
MNISENKLGDFILTQIPMPLERVKFIIEKFEKVNIDKNEFLLKENKISQSTYLLAEGFVRSFVIDNNGQEVTTNIYSDFCFVNEFLSFFKQQPSLINIQTITPCTLYKMSYEDVQFCFHSIPEFREFGRLMLVNNLTTLNERMIGMIKSTAEKRYLNLIEKQPEIFMHVPLKIIASYLGITDTSLSRIRKEISHK